MKLNNFYKIVCALSEASDQPAHPRRLISLRGQPGDVLGPWLHTVKIDHWEQILSF